MQTRFFIFCYTQRDKTIEKNRIEIRSILTELQRFKFVYLYLNRKSN